MSHTASPLRLISRLAGEIGESTLVAEAEALARRVADLRERLTESRALLERELRSRLRQVADGAGRAVARARDAHARGTAAVEAERQRMATIRQELEHVLAIQSDVDSGAR